MSQVNFEEFGQTRTYDLMENGGDISVTAANRGEYVRLYAKYLLEDSIARQFSAFQRGFHTVCGGECLRLFRWEELELLICGSPVLDFEALERVAQYDDGFSRQHPTINLLWEVIHALPLELQKRFLFFCTGSDRVPIKGLGNLNFVISRCVPPTPSLSFSLSPGLAAVCTMAGTGRTSRGCPRRTRASTTCCCPSTAKRSI